MDVREQLLNSEIQHLGQMVQIISYELTVLNDFLREKFGSSYEAYRSTHSLHDAVFGPEVLGKKGKQGAPPAQRTTKNTRANSVQMKKDLDFTASTNSSGNGDANEDNENDLPDMDATFGDGFDDSLEGIDDDNDFVDLSNIPGDVDLPQGSVLIDPLEETTRRKRKAIWGKFIVAKSPQNKLIAKCPTCLSLVSPKVERLEYHYLKCIKGGGGRIRTSPRKSSSAVKEDDPNKPKKPRYKPEGRVPDQVWTYFDVVETAKTEGEKTWKKKIVTCRRCKKDVSPKVERARKHFMICYGIIGENDDDGDADSSMMSNNDQSESELQVPVPTTGIGNENESQMPHMQNPGQ